MNDEDVLMWLRQKASEFTDHLHLKYPDDHRARALFDKLVDVRLLPRDEAATNDGAWKNGKFKHSTGVLFVAARDQSGNTRSPSSLLKTLVHEMAHATRYKDVGEVSHSPHWKTTWLWFLSVATQELGWKVDIKCAECTYYGLCDRRDCPKCTWLQSLCRPYVGPPRGS